MNRITLWSISVLSAFLLILTTGKVFAADSIFTGSFRMEFILIPAGSFEMGAENFEQAFDDEVPRHRVSISKPFYLGKYEVTQAQWEGVTGNNPSAFKGRNNPVEQVSWDDAQDFIKRLNRKEGHNRYRLPTEAEWEYAARAGTAGPYSFDGDAGQLEKYAWYGEDENTGSTHPVGRKQPNAWGLYDMHGNVNEWVQDRYDEDYYRESPPTDPTGPSSGMYRVHRGGGWVDEALYCRSTDRIYEEPDASGNFIGLRLALSPE